LFRGSQYDRERKRNNVTHRIFLVTIAMTSSCAMALRQNVMNIAVVRDKPYEARVDA